MRRHRAQAKGSTRCPFLFVYGTLARSSGSMMTLLLRGRATFVAAATLQARLYLVRHYPGLVPGAAPGERVQGELWQIRRKSLLATLDHYENALRKYGTAAEYRRCLMQVQLAGGAASPAWVYCYRRPVWRLPRIHAGRFVARRRRWSGSGSAEQASQVITVQQ